MNAVRLQALHTTVIQCHEGFGAGSKIVRVRKRNSVDAGRGLDTARDQKAGKVRVMKSQRLEKD
jgi:hypothetical protein